MSEPMRGWLWVGICLTAIVFAGCKPVEEEVNIGMRGPARIGRGSGAILLTLFIGYQVMVWSAAIA